MRAIALHGLLQTALDFERYLPAVTATFVVHLRARPSAGKTIIPDRESSDRWQLEFRILRTSPTTQPA
jgi:hypothetical protein